MILYMAIGLGLFTLISVLIGLFVPSIEEPKNKANHDSLELANMFTFDAGKPFDFDSVKNEPFNYRGWK